MTVQTADVALQVEVDALLAAVDDLEAALYAEQAELEAALDGVTAELRAARDEIRRLEESQWRWQS